MTDPTYSVLSMQVSTTTDVLLMMASHNGGPFHTFQYGGTPDSWTQQLRESETVSE